MAKQKPRRRKGKPYLSHGSEGRVQIGHRLVPDPLEPGAMLPVAVNVRESAIDHMRSRNRINPSQAEAGERFRKIWEMAAVGRNQAMDTTKEFVDGGGVGDPISDGLVAASKDLQAVLRAVGQTGSSLLIAIVGEGKPINEVAKRWSNATGIQRGERAEGYVTGRMIEALDDLVRHWKLDGIGVMANQPRTYRRNGELIPVRDDIRASAEGHTGPVTELSVGRFGDIVETSNRPVDRTGLTPHTSGNSH